jgi:hypothetical protein
MTWRHRSQVVRIINQKNADTMQSGGDYSFTEWQALGFGYDPSPGSLVADPQFANAPGGDFHVPPENPCARKGFYAGR